MVEPDIPPLDRIRREWRGVEGAAAVVVALEEVGCSRVRDLGIVGLGDGG